MKLLKKLIVLMLILGMPFLSKANMECSCTISGMWSEMTLTWYTSGPHAGCANPTAGLALVESSFLGVSLDYYYMDSAEAGLLCSMNRLKEWYPF
jgi:hypothetical protein